MRKEAEMGLSDFNRLRLNPWTLSIHTIRKKTTLMSRKEQMAKTRLPLSELNQSVNLNPFLAR